MRLYDLQDLEREENQTRFRVPKTIAFVVVWSLMSAVAMLVEFIPVDIAAGLGQWLILRARLRLARASAIPFALSFPLGQVPSFLIYLVAYASGFGGLDGPPEWFVAVTLAAGGLVAGLTQFVALPKSGRNFAIWIPATTIAWAVAALGDIRIRGMVVVAAIVSGLVTGVAMLALSPRPRALFRRQRVEAAPGRRG